MKDNFCRTCSRIGMHVHKKRFAVTPAAPEAVGRFRLPRNVVPRRYDLTIIPGPDTRTLTGEVAIEVDVLSPTTQVKVNVKEVEISTATISGADGLARPGQVSYDLEAETAIIDFAGEITVGAYVLKLTFSGKHGANGQGFFASTWKDKDDVEHTVLCTQFESADARAAFPCFDEPAFKATFKARLIVDKALTALGNGDIVSERDYELDPTKKVVEFEETLKMSTYVVAFVVGPFVSSEAVYVNGKRLRIWCMPGEEDETSFGLKAACQGLAYFEDYFRIPYPFGNKIDLVSVPGFAWGGMENVGLIVFQKNLLLVRDDAPDDAKVWVVNIINHEIAHQWFGDLVTMLWWNGLWLNESFATFMQYKATDAFCPEWKQWEAFGSRRNTAYWVDSLRSSHPIEETVERGGDAILLVDAISYEKGCSVLYQTEQFIGEDVLQNGIAAYLKRHAFGNTSGQDLWLALEEAAAQAGLKLPLRDLMEAWVYQVGHPEVSVEAGPGPGQVTISQRPFLLLNRGRNVPKRWPVPVHMQVQTDLGEVSEGKFVFDKKTLTLDVGDYSWVKLNAGGSGFYRVRYSPELLERLTGEAAAIEKLLPIERANILYDARAFLNANIIDVKDYLTLLTRFMQVSDSAVWQAVVSGLSDVSGLCEPPQRAKLARLVAGSLKALAGQNDWIVDGKLDKEKLPFIGVLMPYHLNLTPLIQRLSRKVYKAWREDHSTVSEMVAAQAAMILNYGRARVTKEFYDLQVKSQHARGAEIVAYLETLVELHATSDKPVDLFELLGTVLVYEGWGHGYAVDNVIEQWPAMVAGPTPPITLLYKVRYGLDQVNQPEHLKKLRALFRRHPSRLAHAEIRRMLERVRANVIMRERQSEVLKTFLRKRKVSL